jgi:hypothetical protein
MTMMISPIQGTFGMIQETFGAIQGTFGVIQMIMIISLLANLGCGRPLQGCEMPMIIVWLV